MIETYPYKISAIVNLFISLTWHLLEVMCIWLYPLTCDKKRIISLDEHDDGIHTPKYIVVWFLHCGKGKKEKV